MKTCVVSNEMDIQRNLDYKKFSERHRLDKQLVKASVYNLIHTGKILEREYSIRHHKECDQRESEIVSKYSALEFENLQRLYQELFKLKSENIAMRKALRENQISVEVK